MASTRAPAAVTSLVPSPGSPGRAAGRASIRCGPGAATPGCRLLRTCLLALAVAALLTAAFLFDVVAATRARAVDLLLLARPVRPATATVIVGLDERSAQRLRPRYGPVAAWPRSVYARAIEALQAASPRLIGLAVLFDAPRDDDEELAAALRRAGNVITPVVAQGARAFDPRPGVAQEFEQFVRPTRAVRDARLDEGIVNVTAARDGVVRGLPLVLRSGEEQVPSFALVAVARFTRRQRVIDATPPGRARSTPRDAPSPSPSGTRCSSTSSAPPPSRAAAGRSASSRWSTSSRAPSTPGRCGTRSCSWDPRPRESTSIPRRRPAIAECGGSRSSAARSRRSCTSASWCPRRAPSSSR